MVRTYPAKLLAPCLLASLVLGCASAPRRPAPFRERPDSQANGDLLGPFSGRVVDSQTSRPVKGALVQTTWTFIKGYGWNEPSRVEQHIVSTDDNGSYNVPRQEEATVTGSERLARVRIVVFKKGYVAYRSDRRFEDFGLRNDFTQENNVAKLSRWESGFSHARHLRYVGGGPAMASLTEWQLPEASRELGLEPEETSAEGEEKLEASKFLSAEDVIHVTGSKDEFQVGPLKDETPDLNYSSVHFQAKGKGETSDIAMRVWITDPGTAQKTYGQLAGELPNSEERNEIGDRSLRATSSNRDIYGIVFLEGSRGIVMLLTCGVEQCKSAEMALDLIRLAKQRAEAWYDTKKN